MGFFGFDNKHGRPVPYVWFLIIMVSSLPLMMYGAIESGFDCIEDSILGERTPEEYLKQKGFTIQHAVQECSSGMENIKLLSHGLSVVFFGMLMFTLKPWPLSSWKEDPKDEPVKKRKTPI